jgi:hypothetical protein
MKRYVKMTLKALIGSGKKIFSSVKGLVERPFNSGIKLRYNSPYKKDDYTSQLLFASPKGLSAESAPEVLEMRGVKSPSPDRMLVCWERFGFQELLGLRETLMEGVYNAASRYRVFQKPVCVAIDPHNIPYYGDKKDKMVRGEV